MYFIEVGLDVCIVIDSEGGAEDEAEAVVHPTSDVVELYDNIRFDPAVFLIGFT